MIKDYLELGQIVGTHGIRGELRVNPWCDSPLFAKKFKTLYLDDRGEKPTAVVSCRPHGNLILLQLEGVDNPDKAAALRNKILYLRRSDVKLPKGTWFISELIGCRVTDADTPEKVYGTLTDVSETGANDVWYITDDAGKEYLIPAIKSVVIETRVEENLIRIRPLRGIFDGEEEIRDEN